MSSVVAMSPQGLVGNSASVNLSMVYDPMGQSFTDQGREILPYSARVNSPVKIMLEPEKRTNQSRVSYRSRSARFKLRPVKPGDPRRPEFRFKPPVSTLPTVQYLSPWVSITKGDYRDPRFMNMEERFDFRNIPSGMSGISDHYKPEDMESPSRFTPSNSVTTSVERSLDSTAKQSIQENVSPRPILMSSIDRSQNQCRDLFPDMSESTKSSSVGESKPSGRSGSRNSVPKRVTICSPRTGSVSSHGRDPGPSNIKTEPNSEPTRRKTEPGQEDWQTIGINDQHTNYYSGYLPPELSQKIAQQLSLTKPDGKESPSEGTPLLKRDPHYKPLVGDRNLFLHEPYPTQPKFHLSKIGKARLEGHDRLLKSRGVHPTHFSGLDNRLPAFRTRAPKITLNEALRQQQRQSKSAVVQPSRIQKKVSTIDQFNSQMKKTYAMQASMREMLKE